jgi:hypothetical protein
MTSTLNQGVGIAGTALIPSDSLGTLLRPGGRWVGGAILDPYTRGQQS